MYAVIETGGKQYRVELGTELEVELLDVEPGQEINLERILLIADGDHASVGQPIVADAAVKAKVEHDIVVAAPTRQAAEDASLAARLAKRVHVGEGAQEVDGKPAAKQAK